MKSAKISIHCLSMLGLGIGLIVGGCAQQPRPLPPLVPADATTVTVGHFLGTPLSGTLLKTPDAVSPNDSLAVEVSFMALQRLPVGINPLGARAKLIIASHGANPVRSTGDLTGTAAYATGTDAENLAKLIAHGMFGTSLMVGGGRGALAAGTTARFEVTDSAKVQLPTPSGLGHRQFQVQISRPVPNLFVHANGPATAPASAPAAVAAGANPQSLELNLVVVLDDVAAPEGAGNESADASAGTSQMPILHLETVLLDPLIGIPQPANKNEATAVVAVPFHFRNGSNRAVAAIIRIRQGSAADPLQRKAAERATRDLTASYDAAKADAAARPPTSPDEATVLNLLTSIARVEHRRSSVAYLAAWSGGRICEDVALSSDDKTLAKLAGQLLSEIPAVAKEKPAVGWRMDRVAIGFLVKLQADGELPPELTAILSDRTGEAGRHPSAMEEILRDVRGPIDLDDRLVATNRLYLEDSSPSSRARAYDWLKNRNRQEEPQGYIPLSSARDRRTALDQDVQKRAAAATQPSTQPAGVP